MTAHKGPFCREALQAAARTGAASSPAFNATDWSPDGLASIALLVALEVILRIRATLIRPCDHVQGRGDISHTLICRAMQAEISDPAGRAVREGSREGAAGRDGAIPPIGAAADAGQSVPLLGPCRGRDAGELESCQWLPEPSCNEGLGPGPVRVNVPRFSDCTTRTDA